MCVCVCVCARVRIYACVCMSDLRVLGFDQAGFVSFCVGCRQVCPRTSSCVLACYGY